MFLKINNRKVIIICSRKSKKFRIEFVKEILFFYSFFKSRLKFLYKKSARIFSLYFAIRIISFLGFKKLFSFDFFLGIGCSVRPLSIQSILPNFPSGFRLKVRKLLKFGSFEIWSTFSKIMTKIQIEDDNLERPNYY